MRSVKIAAKTAAVGLAALLSLLVGTPAYAGSAYVYSYTGIDYCATVIESLKPGEQTSRVRQATCGADSAAVMSRLGLVASSTLLMQWWDNANYACCYYTEIYGYDGPCDQFGYAISSIGGFWNDRISSWQVFNSCDNTWAFEHENYAGDNQGYYGSVSYCGGYMNDRISSFKIFR